MPLLVRGSVGNRTRIHFWSKAREDYADECLAIVSETIREGHRSNRSIWVRQEIDMNRCAFLGAACLLLLAAAEAGWAQPPATADVFLMKLADGAGSTMFEFQVTDLAVPFYLGDHYSADMHLQLHDNDIVETPMPGWVLDEILVTGIPYDPIPNGVTVHVDAIYGIPHVTFVNQRLPTIPAPGALLLAALGAGSVGWLRRRGTC